MHDAQPGVKTLWVIRYYPESQAESDVFHLKPISAADEAEVQTSREALQANSGEPVSVERVVHMPYGGTIGGTIYAGKQ